MTRRHCPICDTATPLSRRVNVNYALVQALRTMVPREEDTSPVRCPSHGQSLRYLCHDHQVLLCGDCLLPTPTGGGGGGSESQHARDRVEVVTPAMADLEAGARQRLVAQMREELGRLSGLKEKVGQLEAQREAMERDEELLRHTLEVTVEEDLRGEREKIAQYDGKIRAKKRKHRVVRRAVEQLCSIQQKESSPVHILWAHRELDHLLK